MKRSQGFSFKGLVFEISEVSNSTKMALFTTTKCSTIACNMSILINTEVVNQAEWILRVCVEVCIPTM